MDRYVANFRDGPLGLTLHTDPRGRHRIDVVEPNGQAFQQGVKPDHLLVAVGSQGITERQSHADVVGILIRSPRPCQLTLLPPEGAGSGPRAPTDSRSAVSLPDMRMPMHAQTDDDAPIDQQRRQRVDLAAPSDRHTLISGGPAGVAGESDMLAAMRLANQRAAEEVEHYEPQPSPRHSSRQMDRGFARDKHPNDYSRNGPNNNNNKFSAAQQAAIAKALAADNSPRQFSGSAYPSSPGSGRGLINDSAAAAVAAAQAHAAKQAAQVQAQAKSKAKTEAPPLAKDAADLIENIKIECSGMGAGVMREQQELRMDESALQRLLVARQGKLKDATKLGVDCCKWR